MSQRDVRQLIHPLAPRLSVGGRGLFAFPVFPSLGPPSPLPPNKWESLILCQRVPPHEGIALEVHIISFHAQINLNNNIWLSKHNRLIGLWKGRQNYIHVLSAVASKVPCNANACWLLLKYISVNITNSSTVPYKYASYIFKHFSWFCFDIAKPHLQQNPHDHLFWRWHHQPISIDKVMCLTIHC